MTKEELIRLVKNQIVLRKKQDAKINELTDINTSLSQTVQVSEWLQRLNQFTGIPSAL